MSRLIDLPDDLMHQIESEGNIAEEVIRLIQVFLIANDKYFSKFSINEILVQCQKLVDNS